MVAKHYFLNYPSNHICTTKGKCLVKNALQTYGIETYSAEFEILASPLLLPKCRLRHREL